MRSTPPTGSRTSLSLPGRRAGLTILLALPVVLAACSGGHEAVEKPRPVLVAQPQQMTAATSTFAGDVRAREESPLSFRVGGNMIERRVDVGARVKAGQVLAVLDGSDHAAQARAARAQLAAAEAEFKRARDDQARFAKLAGEQLVSRSAADAQEAAASAARGQVDAARANLAVADNQTAYTRLRAPADGVIATRQAEAGQVVAAGQAVFTLAADGEREVAIAVPERAIGHVTVGRPVQVELWSHPGQRWDGLVREVSPAADPASRTFAVRVTVDAPVDTLELGQSARVHLNGGPRARLGVPLAALQQVEGGSAVFVVDPESSELRLQPVETGAYGQDQVVVESGIAASDWVVAAGGHLLREGLKVAPVDRDNRVVALAPVHDKAVDPSAATGR
ncbi:efflux RND transporter periplasmic adaptor subunit [Marilutibacter alkalisoli]|uniref:Efflux RND transporter periplasmic adaptor subunit n=1 Tax=Marilutibacter alkalisoli TaxID=2591633 RepID=A0A514BNY3_9GAMM|nr:efflux RND transporter periplasmic adaptor subunit [Lysobacter alkalisoli]QDH69096.1 efflux RND transporter periplasmic adaptor subunit [Lysobacter alkalisoli]